MRIFCIQRALQRGLLLAGLVLLLPTKVAVAGPAADAGLGGREAANQKKPVQKAAPKPAVSGGASRVLDRSVPKTAAVASAPPVVRPGPPKLEAFQPKPKEGVRAGGAPAKGESGGSQWIRICSERDDYFPLARLVGWNAPVLKQVTEMRFAMEAGFPRRPPKLPRIVVELPKLGGGMPSAPAPDPMAPKGPDSEAAMEFFSEPATRSGVDVGMETVVVPIFRVAQPPPIPPVQSRANLRQE